MANLKEVLKQGGEGALGNVGLYVAEKAIPPLCVLDLAGTVVQVKEAWQVLAQEVKLIQLNNQLKQLHEGYDNEKKDMEKRQAQELQDLPVNERHVMHEQHQGEDQELNSRYEQKKQELEKQIENSWKDVEPLLKTWEDQSHRKREHEESQCRSQQSRDHGR